MTDSNNDINVLHRSPVFARLVESNALVVHFEINGNAYGKPYYLANDIYPNWVTLVKTICDPQTEKKKRLAKQQEACRKDVEHAFGVFHRSPVFSTLART
jgi:hypothetical protein